MWLRDGRCSREFILSLSVSLSLLSGGEARWSLDDPQTDPRHQHESAWATGESLHRECSCSLLRAVSARFPDALGSKEDYVLPPLAQVFNTFTVQDHIWILKVLKAVLCHSGLRAAWAALWESLLVNTFLELIICRSTDCLYSLFCFWLDFHYSYNVILRVHPCRRLMQK